LPGTPETVPSPALSGCQIGNLDIPPTQVAAYTETAPGTTLRPKSVTRHST